MDSSRRALQNNKKLYSNFKLVFENLAKIRKFWLRTENFGWKLNNIYNNSEALILIKLQCAIYQRILLNELYKLMESFFFTF